ncbi:hypothetical protein LUZ60_009285 [Juncus effusus]|nr:hypothetical protein LUZ60_009285 [Juncus effusus]
METGRRNDNYVLAARNLRKSDLGGVIFGCKHNTIKECLTKQLFGLPSIHFSYIRNIEQGLPLFLFNYSDRQLHGIFEAAGPGQMNIDPYAWSEDGHIRTPFPAQVRIYTRTSCIPVPEAQFKKTIVDNYYKDFHFWFELDHSQTKHLMALFKPGTNYFPAPIRAKHPLNKIVVQQNISYKKTLLKGQNEGYVTNNHDRINQWRPGSNWADEVEWDQDNENESNNNNDGNTNNNGNYYNNGDYNNNNNNNNNNGNYNENYDNNNGNYNENESVQYNTPPNEVNWTNNNNNNQVKWGHEDTDNYDNNNENYSENGNNNYKLGFAKDNEWDVFNPKRNETEQNEWGVYNKNPKMNETVQNEWGVYKNPNIKDNVYESALNKLRAIALEKEELKEEVKFPDEPFDMTYSQVPQNNVEMAQVIKQLKGKTVEMEKKQVESEKEIERLNDIVIQSGKNIFILENRVAELESTLASTNNNSVKSNSSNSSLIQYTAQSMVEKSIFLIGGYDGSKWLSSLDSFYPKKDLMKPLRSMRCSRSYASVSALGDGVFVCGGGNGTSWFDTVECYKRDSDKWVPCPSLSSAKGSLAGLTLNGKIFAIGGGNDVTCLSEVEMFDPILGKWIKTQSMLEKRFAPAAVEFNGAIYTVGGYDGKVYLQTAERYDPREGYWARLPSMNTRRGCASLAVMGVSLYAVGGYDGEKMVSTMETFDPRLTTWVPGRPMRHSRGYSASAILDNNLYLFGGLSSGDKILDNVECFNQRTGWYEPGFKSIGKRCFTSAIAL